MAFEFKLIRLVDFAETDMAGFMHFSNFFRFMETTEAAFFRELGFSIHPPHSPNAIGWPRVHAECDYFYPLRFEDVVEVHLLVREVKRKSIVYEFVFRKVNGTEGREVARGRLIAACVRRDAKSGEIKAVPIPKSITAMIQVAPPEAAP